MGDTFDKINEISGSLADATTAAEELQNERPDRLDTETVGRLLRTFEDARSLVAQLEDQNDGPLNVEG